MEISTRPIASAVKIKFPSLEKVTTDNNEDDEDEDEEDEDDNPWNIFLPVTSIVKLQVAVFPDWSMAVYVTM